MKKVLVLEKDLALSSLLVRALREEGYEADLSQNANDAMSLMDKYSYDLLLIDADVKGFDLLSSHLKWSHDKTLMLLKENGGYDYKVLAIKAKVHSLVKPFSLLDLLDLAAYVSNK